MRRPAWLDRESEGWQRDGLITTAQRAAILDRYGAPAERNAAAVLIWLAVLAAGAGLVLLVGWNWDQLSRAAQLGLVFTVPSAAFAGALAAERRGQDLWTRRLVFLAAIAAGGIFLAVSDVYRAAEPGVPVLWALTLCVTAALVPAPFLTVVAGVVTIAWLLAQAGSAPASWIFLGLGACLALAVEQAPDRVAAGVTATAFAVWTFTIATDTWSDASATTFVFVLLAGAALDAWAHAPADRRPAFARPLPAAVFLLLPLAFLQVWHGQVRAHPWTDVTENPWPTIVLAIVLATVAIWPAIRRRGSPRAAALSALGLVWLVMWLTSPSLVTDVSARLTWAIAFGGATILAGVSLVREAARERSVGRFAIGVLFVASFVAARAIDAQGAIWQSALALFAGALLLGWLGRTWSKGSRPPEVRP